MESPLDDMIVGFSLLGNRIGRNDGNVKNEVLSSRAMGLAEEVGIVGVGIV